ncbi:anhydro-N-acetylmuramic acid kinase [candidate division KSB1 bacterium]
MKELAETAEKDVKNCIGLMSGTSMDGVDSVLVRITGSGKETGIELIDSITYPLPEDLRNEVLDYIAEDSIPLSKVSQLNFLFGKIFAEAVKILIAKAGLKNSDIDIIGSHGQTVFHHPQKEQLYDKSISSTLQIGEPSVIRAETGILTVGDFRVMDVSLGGSGAPLVPFFDYLALSSPIENRGALNIGGIANITVLPADASMDKVFAFDTGPGNMLIDRLMYKLFKIKFDEDGKTAKQAEPNEELLSDLMEHPYIQKAPPKSTGREEFGDNLIKTILRRSNKLKLSSNEIISTVTEFTAASIEKNYGLFIEPEYELKRIIVSGGGVKNSELIRRLSTRLKNVAVESSENYGISPDYKEAIAFAVFANEAVMGNAVNLPKVTGAGSPGILGKIIL